MSLGQGIDLRRVSQAILDGVVSHFAANSTEGDRPLPTRRVVLAGAPASVAADCEQLTVTLAGVGWGPAVDAAPASAPAGTNLGVAGTRHAVYVVTLWRKTPIPDEDGELPSAETLLAAGRQYMRDAGLLSQALVEIGSRVRQIDRSALVQAGMIEPVGPSGDLVGMDGQFIVTALELS